MTESIGTARVDIVVDTSQFDAAITSAKRSVSGMSQAAQAEYNKLTVAEKRRVDSLIRQADTIGLTRDAQIAYNAQMRIGGALGEEIAKKAQAQANAQKELAAAQVRSADIQAEATRRIQAETAAREKNWQLVRAQFADQKRLDAMRADAAHAFGVELAASEQANVASAREQGVRNRLAALLATERGQRILAAQATTQHAAATKGATTAFNQYGLSVKQNAAALRGIPAQITDIATSLASGQRPLTVLLQQGGQLKDMFGGVIPAVRALGGALAGLITPFTVAAAAVLGLTLAWKQGSDEAVEFNKALILTGNYAGTSAENMQAMAAAISDGLGTQHQAAAALAATAASGKFTAEQLQAVAQAAVAMNQATGKAIEETVAEFARLADDPVRAIEELNSKYHLITEAVYEQIKALQEQGRQEEATTLLIKTASAELTQRANDVVANAGYMERAWHNLGAVVRQVWDDIRNAGRASTLASEAQLKKQSAISSLRSDARLLRGFAERGQAISPTDLAAFKASIAQAKQKIAEANRELAAAANTSGAAKKAAEQKASEAAIALDQMAASYASAEAKRAKRIAEAHGKANEAARLAMQAGNAELAKRIREDEAAIVKAIEGEGAKEAAAGGGGRRSGGGGGGSRPSAKVLEFPDFSKGAAQDLDQLAAAEARATESFLDMQAALSGPLAVAEREHAKRVAELNELASQSPVAAAGLTDALNKEAEAHRKNVEAIQAELNPLGTLLDDMRFELDLIGKSNAERAVMVELRRQHIDVMSREGQAALATARAFEAEAESKQRSIDLMDQFRNGAANALTDFVTGAKSAKDALKDFFDELAAQITRAIAEQWMSKLFGPQGSDGAGTSGGNFLGSLFGAIFGGSGWGGIAKGKAFDQPVMAFANGGVVDRTHMFMSGGRLGIMGEAGPEAILPLHRGPDGKLGVKAANDEHVRRGDTYVQTTFVLPDRTTPQTQAQIAQGQQRVAVRASNRNR